MTEFNYTAAAELFIARGRAGLRYRRFPGAAEAICYAVEQLPANVLVATSLHVGNVRYNAKQIGALYNSANYPLARKR